jgi:hypothetical protein
MILLKHQKIIYFSKINFLKKLIFLKITFKPTKLIIQVNNPFLNSYFHIKKFLQPSIKFESHLLML